MIDELGREWAVKKIIFNDSDDVTPRLPTKPRGRPVDLNAISDDELAELMKPVRLTTGPDGDSWEYRLVHADVDWVRTARAKQAAGWSMGVEKDGSVTEGATLTPPKALTKPAWNSGAPFSELSIRDRRSFDRIKDVFASNVVNAPTETKMVYGVGDERYYVTMERVMVNPHLHNQPRPSPTRITKKFR